MRSPIFVYAKTKVQIRYATGNIAADQPAPIFRYIDFEIRHVSKSEA